MPTTPPTLTDAPTAPDRQDRATLSDRSTTAFNYLKVNWVPELRLALSNIFANAQEAYNSAIAAAASAFSAAAAGNSTVWVSGTTYAQGVGVYSPITFRPYRRKTAGAGTTDPSADSTNWADIGALAAAGAGGTTSTAGIVLTSTSAGAMSLTPATPGLYVALPDATTCPTGAVSYAIYNNGEYDVGVKDSTGTKLGWVRPKTGAIIGLADKSTAAGAWTPYGLEKLGVTARVVLSSAALTNVNVASAVVPIALDANRTLFVWGSAYTYAIVYDASTQQWGAPATISAAGGGTTTYTGILVATDKVLVAYKSSTLYLAVLSVSGTAITVNSPVNTSQAIASGYVPQIVAIGGSVVLGYHTSSFSWSILAITVSGTTPSYGSAAVMPYTTVNGINLYASGSIVRTVGASSASTLLFAKPYTVSGTTLTAGTVAVATANGDLLRSYVNGNGNIVAQYLNTNLTGAVFKLTSTTEAVSVATLANFGPTMAQCDMIAISAGKTLSVCQNGTSLITNILTDTAGTASVGTQLSPVLSGSLSAVATLGVASNVARVALTTSATNSVAAHMVLLDCSGASPTLTTTLPTQVTSVASAYPPVASSSQANVRDPRHLRTTTSSYFVGNGYFPFDIRFGAASVNRRINPAIVHESGSGYGYGATGSGNADSWFATTLDASSSGWTINRVEAAE